MNDLSKAVENINISIHMGSCEPLLGKSRAIPSEMSPNSEPSNTGQYRHMCLRVRQLSVKIDSWSVIAGSGPPSSEQGCLITEWATA